MEPANIELPNDKILKLDELVSGDVEITIALRTLNPLRIKDLEKAIIPKERRALIAHMLVQ